MPDVTSNVLDDSVLFTTGKKDKVCGAMGIGKFIDKFLFWCLGQRLVLKVLRTLR